MVAELVEHAQTRQEPPSRPGQARAEAGPAEATGLRTYVVDTSVPVSYTHLTLPTICSV